MNDVADAREVAEAEQARDKVPAPGAARLAGPGLPDAGAWPRYFARLFDMWWQIPLVGFILGFILSLGPPSLEAWTTAPAGAKLSEYLCVVLALILDAALLARFGTSPGKALLGLRVVAIDGARIGLRAALRRNGWVWVSGLALTIVPLSLITMTRQGWRLRQGKPASYDSGKYRVEARPLSLRRAIGFIVAVVGLTLVLGLLLRPDLLNADDDTPPAPVAAASTWTNPETGIAVTVPPGWEHRMHEDDDGLPSHQFTLSNGRAALLFKVRPASVLTLADMARETTASYDLVEMGAGRYEDFHANPSWAAEGFMDDEAVTRFKVRVMRHDHRYWHVLVAQEYGYADTDVPVEALQALLWSSVTAP